MRKNEPRKKTMTFGKTEARKEKKRETDWTETRWEKRHKKNREERAKVVKL